jgi:hypothetical protein
MKLPFISKTSAAGLGLLFTLLASSAIAGPGPDYWARMNKNQKPASSPAVSQTKAESNTKSSTAAKPDGKTSNCCVDCQSCGKKC